MGSCRFWVVEWVGVPSSEWRINGAFKIIKSELLCRECFGVKITSTVSLTDLFGGVAGQLIILPPGASGDHPILPCLHTISRDFKTENMETGFEKNQTLICFYKIHRPAK
jgi:hypothetical protein